MIINMYVTFDAKAKLYSRPFYTQTRGMAIRTFADIANDKDHPIGRHPEDYTLYEIGTFDDVSGKIEHFKEYESLGLASAYLKEN